MSLPRAVLKRLAARGKNLREFGGQMVVLPSLVECDRTSVRQKMPHGEPDRVRKCHSCNV